MHHKNHKNSTSNHSSPQHVKNNYPTTPAPQSGPKRSVLSRFRERFKEKPATAEEVKQLGLNAKREIYKSQIQRAKSTRPGRFDRIVGGGGQGARGRSRQNDGGLFGGGDSSSGSWLMGPESVPSLSFITGEQPKGRGRKQDSGFGKGLTDMF